MLLVRQKIDGDPVSPDSTVPTAPTPVSGRKASSCLLRSSFQKCDPETVGLVSSQLCARIKGQKRGKSLIAPNAPCTIRF
jgi:hypothetical protein